MAKSNLRLVTPATEIEQCSKAVEECRPADPGAPQPRRSRKADRGDQDHSPRRRGSCMPAGSACAGRTCPAHRHRIEASPKRR